MAITAVLVKELRERTGAGMMECKKALVETEGNLESAIELMRKSGQTKAAKKAGRIAAEGVIVIHASEDGRHGAMVEVNSETDFVSKDPNFTSFAEAVAERALYGDAQDVSALLAQPLHEGEETTVEQAREGLVAKLGENLGVRRMARYDSDSGVVASYVHGVRIGVMVEVEGGDRVLGRDIAMHVAASNPVCVSPDDVPRFMQDKERDIYMAQTRESGKPNNIIEKVVEGRMRKWLAEITLHGQAFIKDPDTTVGKLLEKSGARVARFQRFEVGEGIEKKSESFAEEVMAQARGA